jgi:hypothetical protein
MSLSRARLERALLRIFTRPNVVNTVEHARRLWWETYDIYARDAQDVSGDSVLTVNSYRFLKKLRFDSLNNYLQAADEFDAAFRAYWQGATFNVGQLIVTAPSACPNIGGNGIWATETASVVSQVRRRALTGRLVPIFQRQSQVADSQRAAAEIAAALHDSTTKDVLVTITGFDTSTPTPIAISNTCTVF